MDDTISRREAIDAVEHITSSMSVCVNTDECHGMKRMQRQAVIELTNLPSAQPYTEEEIQAMQDLEQAQIDKAYELGWKEGREALREETWEYVRDRFD